MQIISWFIIYRKPSQERTRNAEYHIQLAKWIFHYCYSFRANYVRKKWWKNIYIYISILWNRSFGFCSMSMKKVSSSFSSDRRKKWLSFRIQSFAGASLRNTTSKYDCWSNFTNHIGKKASSPNFSNVMLISSLFYWHFWNPHSNEIA